MPSSQTSSKRDSAVLGDKAYPRKAEGLADKDMRDNKSGGPMPLAVWALAVGAFGIGTSEFVIMGLLPEVAAYFNVSVPSAGLLISGYALGVVVAAPLLSLVAVTFPRKVMLLLLMGIFTLGNFLCAIAPTYGILMVARVVTSFSHGAFFGIGAVVAASLVAENKKASAVAAMFTGLTLANIMGVPMGTWIGQHFGWRATFWAVTFIGPLALLALAVFVPKDEKGKNSLHIRQELQAVLTRPVALGMLATVFGFAGVFATFAYIAPYLTEFVGFGAGAIAPVQVLFGLGLIAGNITGGKWADANLRRALYGTLLGLGVVLVLLAFFGFSKIAILVLMAAFGFMGFATVPPLQMDILSRVDAGGGILVSALNIAAFNLGNALGPWVGGLVIGSGASLFWLPITSSLFAFIAIIVVFINKPGTTRAKLPNNR